MSGSHYHTHTGDNSRKYIEQDPSYYVPCYWEEPGLCNSRGNNTLHMGPNIWASIKRTE